MITRLNGADHVTDHEQITWLSCSDDMPQEAITKELSRHESRNHQAIIMVLSFDESCCSASNHQADEQPEITQLSWQ